MPCACTAIRLILRWSCGLPSVSTTRACGTPKRPERGQIEAHEVAVLGVALVAGRDRPFPQLLAVDGIDEAAALGAGAEDAELAALLARQALDGLAPRSGSRTTSGLSRRVMRARMRSPWPSAGSPARCRAAAARAPARGGARLRWRSQTAGSPISSPSASRATISSTATGGSLPALLEALAVAARAGPRRPSRSAAA